MEKYFNDIKSFMDLKKKYKKLCFKLHPDLGGDKEEFQKMQNEYENIFEYWKKNNNSTQEKKYYTTESVKDYREMVEKLLKLGLDFDLVGNWIWIIANKKTYPIREKINALGFIYSKSKKKFWKDLTGNVKSKNKGYKSKKTYNQIKDIYGCKQFKGAKALELE